jgi:hypothetical protein
MRIHSTPPLASTRRRAAIAIACTTALALVALFHHPVVSRTVPVQESIAQIASVQMADGLVHGALIVMLALLAAGFAVFGALLGSGRTPVIAAMAAYACGCVLVVGAMLLDGFVVPQLARQFMASPQGDIELLHIVLRVIGTVIQVLTKAGLLSMCAALLMWSYALLSASALPWSRWCASVGLLAGVLPALIILLVEMRLTPASLMAIFGVHAAWNFSVAAMLLRTSVSSRAIVGPENGDRLWG